MTAPLELRPATPADLSAIWSLLEPVILAGETYAFDRDMTTDAALAGWMAPAHEVFIALYDGDVAGTYYLRANQKGGGAHVANAAFITAADHGRRGVARGMCLHAIDRARTRGFKAMQFNFVVESNSAAVHLWRSLGFAIVGRLPGAFHHPRLGYVDALVMHRDL